jgi:hypothetical protein
MAADSKSSFNYAPHITKQTLSFGESPKQRWIATGGKSEWADMMRRDMLKNDKNMLQTIREKNETLRDVYDMRQYYVKRGGGRNGTLSTLQNNLSLHQQGSQSPRGVGPWNANPQSMTKLKLNTFMPSTQRDWNPMYRTLIKLPNLDNGPPLAGSNLEALL